MAELFISEKSAFGISVAIIFIPPSSARSSMRFVPKNPVAPVTTHFIN